MKSEIDPYLDILRQKGLKVTPKRKAVIDMMLHNQCYFSPREVWGKLKRTFKTIKLASIYRILENLEDACIITRVKQEDRRLYYYLCAIDNHDFHHHHFICTSCHGVQEVHQCYVDQMYKYIEKELGGKPESHSLQIEGLCMACKE